MNHLLHNFILPYTWFNLPVFFFHSLSWYCFVQSFEISIYNIETWPAAMRFKKKTIHYLVRHIEYVVENSFIVNIAFQLKMMACSNETALFSFFFHSALFQCIWNIILKWFASCLVLLRINQVAFYISSSKLFQTI